MKLFKVTENDYQVSHWSGGQTKQIYLYPESGEYKIGKFDYRISSATVDLPSTTFSKLPGYKRIILSLNNPLTLNHGFKDIELEPLQKHYFDGNEITTSVGSCTDFNLIYRSDLSGHMDLLKNKKSYILNSNVEYVCYFIDDCIIRIQCKNHEIKEFNMKHNNSLCIFSDTEILVCVKNIIGNYSNVVAILSWVESDSDHFSN